MLEILRIYGIPSEIINAIKVLYSNTKSTILTPDGETEHFDITMFIGAINISFHNCDRLNHASICRHNEKKTVSSISQKEALTRQPSTSLKPIFPMILLFFQIIKPMYRLCSLILKQHWTLFE